MNNHCFGCDFGSYHLKIYHKEQDSCLMQHNMVAVQDKKESKGRSFADTERTV